MSVPSPRQFEDRSDGRGKKKTQADDVKVHNVFKVFCISVLRASQYPLWTVCMYVYTHFYLLCLTFDDCTFLPDCLDYESVIDTRRFSQKEVDEQAPPKKTD